MTKSRKLLSVLLFFILFITVSSFKIAPSLCHQWLPADFNPNNGILLIQKHPFNKNQNDRMVKFLKKKYPWRYEIATVEQIKQDEKYSDTRLYQFAILWTDFLTPINASGYRHDVDGHFLDRSTGTVYPGSSLGYNYGRTGDRQVIKAIAKKYSANEKQSLAKK